MKDLRWREALTARRPWPTWMGEATALVAAPEPGPAVPQDSAAAPAAPVAPAAMRPATRGPAMSDGMRAYFETLHGEAMRCYAIAKQARFKGKDPSLQVEIPPAEDLAARVEAQVGPPGVAAQIRAATAKLGNREVVSLQVAQDVADQLHNAGAGNEKALDQAVRTGLSILTEGILVAPLEGIAEVKVGANLDGSDYVDLYFAGPIRAAGGTAQAMAVLIADLVRRRLNIGAFAATDGEVERYKEEIAAYKVEAHLQYNPTPEEIERIARNCPVCINGEGTEKQEVAGNRDLARVETNQLRGGACLVMAEGMILKAPKVLKHVEKLGLQGWGFLKAFVKKEAEAELPAGAIPDIPPKNGYLKEIIAGRPVFAYPSQPGGFRLRYGRARTAGLAANAFHPATMTLVDDFLAVGTQLKVERPGKGTLATPCDELEGPTALLKNGSLVRLQSVAEAKAVRSAVAEIVDLGEILIPFGEFAENNANLPDASWCWEWWLLEHEKAAPPAASSTVSLSAKPAADFGRPGTLSGAEMVHLAEATGVPLHPDATLLWHDVTLLEVRALGEWVKASGAWDDGALWLPAQSEHKEILVKLLAPHNVQDGRLRIEERFALPLLRCLGLDCGEGRVLDTPRRRILYDPCQPDLPGRFPTVELVSRLAGFPVRPKAPTRIGGRMGRPEKASPRLMKPPPHGLVPLGPAGGAQRLVRDAAAQGVIHVEVGERRCVQCKRTHWRTFCDCGGHTEPVARRAEKPAVYNGDRPMTSIDMRAEVERARSALKLDRLPETIKGVTGVINKDKVPEPLEKALLRARHDLSTNKDGTVRFDMIDVPLTHFRPREIGASVDRLRWLGYTHDRDGAPLERDDQLMELRVQDIVVAESCVDYLLRATKYLDDLLERFYGLPPYYKCEKRRDLIGHLAIGLAPHTSGGVLCRIIGHTKALAHFGHPYFHTAKRRNCDGDEDSVLLLLDGLLNFSRAYVPDKRGGLMDLPLVLSTRIDPNEIDKEAHNLDTLRRYPLEFYEATTRHAHAKEVAKIMGLVEGRIGTEAQYEGLGFTHDTRDIAEGPAASAYKTLGSMMDKMTAQMELARKIRAVDEADVGKLVIGTHLLPDIMGNLKSFSKQSIRCPKCNEKFRRMPLKGVCLACGNPNLTLTVHEGSVRKYLEICKAVAMKYKIDAYTRQRIALLEASVESLFQNDKVRKPKLSDFL